LVAENDERIRKISSLDAFYAHNMLVLQDLGAFRRPAYHGVTRIAATLRQQNLREDTLIPFLPDNSANAEDRSRGRPRLDHTPDGPRH
jgi:hypothetical protein